MTKIVVIGSGQSNAVGGVGSEGGDLTPNPKVKVRNASGWVTAVPGVFPFYPTEPGMQPRNNVFWNYCKELQEQTGADVYFILSGLGETPISQWKAPSAQQWVNLAALADAAFASPELAGITKADYFLWFQGGNDPNNTHYREDLLELRQNCINKGWITSTTPFVCCEIKSDNLAKQATIDLWNDPISFPWMGYASNADIPRPDHIPHPTGDGCVIYGRERLYNAAMNIPRKHTMIYKEWTPILCGGSNNPIVDYDEPATFGGSTLDGNRVDIWFKLVTQSISGGAGGVFIKGLPYPIGLTIPAQASMLHGAVASLVDGLVGFDTALPIILQTQGPDGIKLSRPTTTGMAGLGFTRMSTSAFTIAGSLSYLID